MALNSAKGRETQKKRENGTNCRPRVLTTVSRLRDGRRASWHLTTLLSLPPFLQLGAVQPAASPLPPPFFRGARREPERHVAGRYLLLYHGAPRLAALTSAQPKALRQCASLPAHLPHHSLVVQHAERRLAYAACVTYARCGIHHRVGRTYLLIRTSARWAAHPRRNVRTQVYEQLIKSGYELRCAGQSQLRSARSLVAAS